MPSMSQIKKVLHTVTVAEEIPIFFTLSLLWDTPFEDTNYVVACNVETVFTTATGFNGEGGSGYLMIQNLTRFGFTASMVNNWQPGDRIVLHGAACHV